MANEERKPGPNPKPISPDEIRKWAGTGATWDEIASRLDISPRQLRRRRRENEELDRAFKRGHDGLRISLRAEQVAMARAPRKKRTYHQKDGTKVEELGDYPAGKSTMLVWLGKNLLGQTDRQEVSARISRSTEDLAHLTNDELEDRLAILMKLEGAIEEEDAEREDDPG